MIRSWRALAPEWRDLRSGPRYLRPGRDLAIGVAWGAIGLWSATAGDSHLSGAVTAIVAITAVAVGLFRSAPASALLLIWISGFVQVASVTDLLLAQWGLLLVAYGTARHGRPLTVWLGGLSVPAGAALGEYYVFHHSAALPAAIDVATPLLRHTGLGVATVFLLGVSIPAIAWALGLLVRLNKRYQRSATDRELARTRAAAAEQTAELRARQTELARDVHDLVGHSLAVIIAQADAARTASGPPGGPVGLALENIAAVARSSLGEVRQVLAQTQSSPRADTDLTALVGRARAAGTVVHESSSGPPIELSAPTRTAVYRVLQEMLTNAIRHGPAQGRIDIEHRWSPGEYAVKVTNRRASPPNPGSTGAAGVTGHSDGMGLTGMRSRLGEIGGRLELPPDTDDAKSFTVIAHIPVS